MLDVIQSEAKERMRKTLESVTREFGAIRTGKASVSLLDTVRVDAYGTRMPLNQLATIAAPEPRLLVVQAFDKTTVGDIVKAIQMANLGLNPMAEGQTIRVPVPPLNEERRKELVKLCRTAAEDARVAIRNIRRDANDRIKKEQKAKTISEDEQKEGLAEVQKMTDDYIKKIDEALEKKEKQVMEV